MAAGFINSASSSQISREILNGFIRAAQEGNNVAILEFLNEYGMSLINQKDPQGRTALMLATQGGHKDSVTLLLEKGASLEERDGNGWTALTLAKLILRYEEDEIAIEEWSEMERHRQEKQKTKENVAVVAELLAEWTERRHQEGLVALVSARRQRLKRGRPSNPFKKTR